MMSTNIPRTPFATRLSGDAKETELRIRGIFQWKKRRPPVWLFAFIVLVIFGCIGLVSCREKEDTLWLGLNARVVEIDTEEMILYIQDIDESAAVFGQRCALDCKQAAEEKKLIFVDYETSNLVDIPFAEFQVGDELVISMYTSQKERAKDASARAEQVQLGTQRLAYKDNENELVMRELFTASNVSDVVDSPNGQLLVAPNEDGQSFCAAYFTERNNYELVIAVWDADTNSIVGTPFRAANSGGIPQAGGFEDRGEQRLYYSANGMRQGVSGGQAGTIRLVDSEMVWSWPVEGDIRELTGQPYAEYLAFWENHLALQTTREVDVFVENPDYGLYEGAPPQWSYEGAGYHVFDANTLMGPDRERIRAWLEKFSQNGNNASRKMNDSASWRILALERSGLHKKCTLLCVGEYDETAYLRAVLSMDHYGPEPLEVLDWEIGYATPEEISAEAASYDRLSTNRDLLIKDCIQTKFPEHEVYFMEVLDEEVSWGRVAITRIEPMGRARLNEETIGVVYQVTVKTYLASMNGTQGEFTYTLVLSADNNVTLNGILGEATWTEGKTVEEIVESVRLQITPEGKPILTEYFKQWYDRVYFLGEEPGEPQEGDMRIDSVRFLGSEVTFETTGEAYLVRTSVYNERIEDWDSPPVTKWWPVEQKHYLVLGRAMDGELEEVRGDRYEVGHSVSRMILEESYGVSDWEVTLRHDANPYPQPLALGWWNDMALSLVKEQPTIERLENWEPIHWEGDYWERYTLDGLSILRQYSTMAAENNYVITTVEMTRDDFSTPRGIKLGSTRAEVAEAYPELKSGDYWGKYPGEEYLWYCEDSEDFGPALIFFFENHKVSKIVLNNMFN